MEVVTFGSVGTGKEAEEIMPSFLPCTAFCCVFVTEALTAMWCYSLFSLNTKRASLRLLPAACAVQPVRSREECIINALNFFSGLDHLLFELSSIC